MTDFRPRPIATRKAVQLGRPAHADGGPNPGQVPMASNAEWIRKFAEALQAILQQVQAVPLLATVLSDVLSNDRLLSAGPDIDFVDGGAKGALNFILVPTGITASTYGAALKIPIIQFDGNGRAVTASEAALGTAAALDADNDNTLAANSSTRVPTQAAVKAFVSQAVAGLLEYKGDLNCSANPNYPAAEKGDSYVVTVAGRIGGASGKLVDIGDFIIARADNAGGTEAAVGASWFVLEHNLAGALLAANNLADVTNPATARANIGAGTVTSVDVSGGTTGLTFSGGAITGAGTLTMAGTLGVTNGGTGTATAFTAGSILFAGASGVYSQNNGSFFWDNSNARLGLGTSTPSERLEAYAGSASFVVLKATNTAGYGKFGVRDTGDAYIEAASGKEISFWNGSRRLTITSGGNIYATIGATGMTDGFFYIPAAAGPPTGTPTVIAGRVPMYYDATNNHFYIYNGAWKKVLLA